MTSHQLHILVVDDDNGHRKMLKTLLSDWGYSIHEAEDGEIAVAKCKERAFDLVLMDVRMPKKSGLEALKEVKAHNPAIHILIMTAYSNIEAAVEAIKAGAYDYLTKPLDFNKLQISLKNIFAYSTLQQENALLHNKLAASSHAPTIIGKSQPMQQLLSMAQTIAPSDATVLITGESGTGKELIAKTIHVQSPRSNGPFVAVNCAALNESLLESELFGHEKGAFTGADKRREGRFVLAHKGTIFLDEVGEMPLLMQAKLLRVLQEREVQRVGSSTAISIDVRIITATNKDLHKEVEEGRFREDLFYRLNVVALTLPPLRDRKDDIPLLATHFMNHFAGKNKKAVQGFTPNAMNTLINYSWPGNIRELENTIERAVILLTGEYISERELPPNLQHSQQSSPMAQSLSPEPAEPKQAGTTLEDIERNTILKTLALVNGNKTEAAKRLGITRKTLHTKLQKYREQK